MATRTCSTLSQAEIQCLPYIWHKEKFQTDLISMKWNHVVYDAIASRLSVCGYYRSYSQVKSNLISLLSLYKAMKEESTTTGKNWNNWPYFSIIDSIMRTKDSIAPDILVQNEEGSHK